MQVGGRYFFPHSARFVEAHAALSDDGMLRVTGGDGASLAEAPFRKVRVSPRLAKVARRLSFADGGIFETYDNDGIDEFVRRARRFPGESLVDGLERSWRSVAISVLLAAAAGALFVMFGIPAIAATLARQTPPSVISMMSDKTLATVDDFYLRPSKLTAAERGKAHALFERVAAHEPRGEHGYALLFRGGGRFGANAFALPDGRIVLTDQLWAMFRSDDEIEGVFAHEMAHVNHDHGLVAVYEASLVPAAIAVVTGDLSQVSQLSVILPGILLQSAYSRGAEQEADDDAAAMLVRLGGHPAKLAALLKRLDRRNCGKSGCGPSWLGNHPQTDVRVKRLIQEDPGARK